MDHSPIEIVVPVSEGGIWKYIRLSGEEAFPHRGNALSRFEYGICGVIFPKGLGFAFCDQAGSARSVPDERVGKIGSFRGGWLSVEVEGFVEFRSPSGSRIARGFRRIPKSYLKGAYYVFENDEAAVFGLDDLSEENGIGIITSDGSWLVEPEASCLGYGDGWSVYLETEGDDGEFQFRSLGRRNRPEQAVPRNQVDHIRMPSSGKVRFRRRGKWGYFDIAKKNGVTEVIEPRFDEALDFSGNFAPVARRSLWGLVNADGIATCESRFHSMKSVGEGYFAALSDQSKWGVVDQGGSWILDPHYDEIGEVSLSTQAG